MMDDVARIATEARGCSDEKRSETDKARQGNAGPRPEPAGHRARAVPRARAVTVLNYRTAVRVADETLQNQG